MKNILISCFLFLTSYLSLAHPGIGVVKDSKGNIYYTDLKQVWKTDPLKKTRMVVVSGVHTHELFMDDQDNLYGEHLWYNGERLDTWGHYVWCLKNTGELVKETEPAEGFLDNYSFVRDSSGNMYWVQRFTNTRFIKKARDGVISTLAEGKFGFISWLHCSAGGTIYFAEGNRLHKLSPEGKFTLLADDLKSKVSGFTGMDRKFDGYGIWTDAADNVYIAMIGAKKVNRINPDGRVQTILYSASLWTACSGIFDDGGNLWLLEYSVANETRVRKISKNELAGLAETQRPFVKQTQLLITIAVAAMIVVLWFLLKRVLNKRKIKLQSQPG